MKHISMPVLDPRRTRRRGGGGGGGGSHKETMGSLLHKPLKSTICVYNKQEHSNAK